MPQASYGMSRVMGPAKTHTKQLGGQQTRLSDIEFEIISCPQAACIEFDGRLPAQDGIRRTNRKDRRCLTDQLQCINEAGSPKGLVTRMLHVTSLHTQRIAWESSIFGCQQKFSWRCGSPALSALTGELREVCGSSVRIFLSCGWIATNQC